MNWNPLYPADDEANSLDESIREAEWEDSMRELEQQHEDGITE